MTRNPSPSPTPDLATPRPATDLRELAEEAIEGGYRFMEVEPQTTLRLLRIETVASILLSVANAVMPETSPYGCPHSRDWLNGVLDDLRAALQEGTKP